MADASNTDPDQARAPQMDAVTEDTQMEIHKPKPVHNWREFLTEIGVVVIGVCIALAAEQSVEWVHDSTRAAQARENIRTEIADDTGLMVTRDRTEGCVSHRLDEVDGLIRASAAGALSQGPIWVGRPFLGSMADSQYRSAAQSGAVSLLPNEEQSRYARIYAEFAEYYQSGWDEQLAWADLRTLENHPASSSVLDWQLRSAMQKARTARFRMETSEYAIRTDTASLGIKPNVTVTFKQQAACISLDTSRAEAERKIVQGGISGVRFDSP